MDTGSKFVQQMPRRTFLTKQYLGKPISLIISWKRGEQERVHMMLLSFFSVWHIYFSLPLLLISVVDPEWFFSDPDRTFQIVSDPEPDPVSDRKWTFANIFNINLPFYYRLVSVLGCIHIMTRYSFYGIFVWKKEFIFLNWAFCWVIVKFYQFSERFYFKFMILMILTWTLAATRAA